MMRKRMKTKMAMEFFKQFCGRKSGPKRYLSPVFFGVRFVHSRPLFF